MNEKMVPVEYGSVVCLLTNMGEIIGRVTEIEDGLLTLESPRTFMTTSEGMGFAPSVSMCTEDEPDSITFNLTTILCVTKPKEGLVDAWRQACSGLVTATSME